VIEVQGVSHAFGDRTVLHGLRFTVPGGTVCGFIGPNGAGKTTTLRIMATLLAPSAGDVVVAGHSVTRAPDEVRRVLGYMPDSCGVYERITAEEYLDFFASAQGLWGAKRARAIENVVELTEVGELRKREVAALSKGQKQRLLLARTLLHDPSVLILDEPASDLDPRARIELRALLAELGRMGKTVLLSSHILTELADVCGWIGILQKGRVVAAGPIGEVQAALRPGQRVRVRVLAEGALAERVLRGVEGVREVRVLLREGEGEGPTQLEVSYEGDAWRIAALVGALAEARVPVAAVEPEKHDLERIFLDLTGTATASATPAVAS